MYRYTISERIQILRKSILIFMKTKIALVDMKDAVAAF